jgi:SAM-dependent methyltransferase
MGDGVPVTAIAAPWLSYDAVAETYQRVAVPRFAAMARDLVEAVGLRAGEDVLDVGTGTGLVASVAAAAVRPAGRIVGVDPARSMLARVHPGPERSLLVAMAPGLPFSPEAFDVVLANLVLSHLPDHAQGLADMVRVLRRRGRLACTAWAPEVPAGPDNQQAEAHEIVASVRAQMGLDLTPLRDAVPWEGWFGEREHLEATLVAAGLVETSLRLQTYRWNYGVDEFLSGWGSQGRYLRCQAGESRWQEFVGRARTELQGRFGDTIGSVNQAWIAVGRQP